MKKIFIGNKISLEELSKVIGIEQNDILKNIFLKGIILKKNELMNFEFIKNFCKNVYNIEIFKSSEKCYSNNDFIDKELFIAIAGNVNSGKTTLLDFITKKNNSFNEVGKITQFISVYNFFYNKKNIFLFDLPGHKVFFYLIKTYISFCNLLFLIISVNDRIDINYENLINIANENNCIIIICINKIDKNKTIFKKNISRYKEVKISSKIGYGIKNLLNEITNCNFKIFKKKNNNSGLIINSYIKNNEFFTTLFLLNGELKKGDLISFKHIDYKFDEIYFENEKIYSPSIFTIKNVFFPIEIYFNINNKTKHTFKENYKENYFNFENFFIKTDNHNIATSLKFFYENLKFNEKINILKISLGNILDNDIDYCLFFNCKIITIGLNIASNIKQSILKNKIFCKEFNLLHNVIDFFKENYLCHKEEITTGTAIVKNIFPCGKNRKIAGCKVIAGEINFNQKIKIFKELKLIFKGKIDTMKIRNKSVNKVIKNDEFGLIIKNFNDIEIDFKIESVKYINDK